MANPLSLYVPIKQDPLTQAAVKKLAQGVVKQITPALDAAKIVHYARLILIPNANGKGTQALLLITTFDNAMDPYLRFFWSQPGFRAVFEGFAIFAATPPNPPVKDLNSFELFINNNNLSEPSDLYAAYPQSVLQIIAAFKKKPGPKPPAKTAKAKPKAKVKKAKSKSRR